MSWSETSVLKSLLATVFSEPTVNDLRHVCFEAKEPVVRTGWAQNTGNRPRPGRSLSSSAEVPPDGIVAWILGRAGMRAAAYRATSLDRRVSALLRKFRVPSVAALQTHLEQCPDLVPRALDTLLIGVTEFFRDVPVFEYLRRLAIPELLQSRRTFHVYAVGVSSGQELYSLAILLAEAGVLAQSRLVGIDCRHSAIAEARRGWFSTRSLAEVSRHDRDRYFERHEGGWRVRSELRDRIEWREADALCLAPEPFPSDLVLFRNVAIYLRPAEGAALWQSLCAQLSSGGYLIAGKAEKPPVLLPLTRVVPCVFKKSAA